MRKLTLFLLFTAACEVVFAQTFPVSSRTFTFNDPARTGGTGSGGGPGRQIQSLIYYPAIDSTANATVAAGRFPVVVFGHGFSMTATSYSQFFKTLAQNGYIVVAPRTEEGLSPTHTEFGKDLALVLGKTLDFDTAGASPFFGKVLQKGAIAGHSMGGGCTFLSDQYNSRATCYLTMAPAITNPSSSLAARNISKPMCILSGTRDCVAGYAGHQKPMYDSLFVSTCKALVSITDARHCSFSDGNNTACNFGEGTSGCASSPLTTANQIVMVNNIMLPYFGYFLKGICSEWNVYQNYITNTAALSTQQNCNMVVPTSATISGDTIFCQGSTASLSAVENGFNYTWSTGATAQNTIVNSAASYTVTVSNAYCGIQSPGFQVAQRPLPSVTGSINGSDTVCYNQGNLIFSVSAVSNADNIVWTLPSGWSGNNLNTTSATVTNYVNSGTISVAGTNTCGTGNAVSLNVTVQQVPGSIGIILGPDTVCANSSGINLFINPVNNATNYTWTYPTGWSATRLNSDSPNFTSGTNSGTITVFASNSCGQTSTVSKNVSVITTPTISGSIVGDTNVCKGYTSTLNYSYSGNGNNINWTVPSGWNITSTSGLGMVTVPSANSGTIQVNTANQCGNSNFVSLNVSVVDTPQPLINVNGSTIVCNIIGEKYQWYENGVAVGGLSTNNTFNGSPDKTYYVVVTNATGCSGRSNTVSFTVGIDEILNSKETLVLYPNPTSDFVYITATKGGENWQLLDVSGKVIAKGNCNNNLTQINLAGFAKGIYAVKISDKTAKVIVD